MTQSVYGLIVSLSTADVLALYPALPLYVPVIECDPTASVDVVNAAFPLLIVTVPNTLAPSLNVIDPVGVPDVEGFTLAVNVTTLPCVAGFSDELTVVEVPALLTTSVSAAEVLPVKFVLPLYTAVIECVPTVKFNGEIFANPFVRFIV